MNARAGCLVVTVAFLVAVACGSAPHLASSTPSASGFSAPPPGTPLIFSWDGVDGRMLLSDVALGREVDTSTWAWDGRRWAQVPAPGAIPSVDGDVGFLVFDGDRKLELLLVFGDLGSYPGSAAAAAARGVWEWDGRTWTHASPANAPKYAYAGSGTAAYDPVRHETVFFDGTEAPGGTTLHTWLLSAVGWRELDVPAPIAALRHLSFDPAHGAVVGLDDAYGTWRFDGMRWSELPQTGDVPTSPAPMGRQGPAITFDPVREQWVLFGGYTASVDLGDTWIGDETGWRQVEPSKSPSPRDLSVLAWDAGSSAVVMYGGESHNPDTELGDTWGWDGSSWTQLAGPYYPPPPSPSAESAASAA